MTCRLSKFSAAVSGLVAGTAVVLATPIAIADPTASSAQEADFESVRPATELDMDIVAVEPSRDGGPLNVTLEVRNTSNSTAQNLQVTTRRGNEVTTPAEVRTEMAVGQYPYYSTTQTLDSLEPGGSTRVELSVPTALGEPATLAITEPGVYPLMFALSGELDAGPAQLADERITVTFGDVAGQPQRLRDEARKREQQQAQEDEPESTPEQEPSQPNPLTLIYPITAPVDIVPGETGDQELILASEELAGQLAPNGRVTALLDAYLKADLKGAGCVALDPALVDAADRMADGYTVDTTRPSITEPPQRLRDTWGQKDDDNRGAPGTGSQDAQAFLNKLADLDCIITMPWANTDLEAIADAHNNWLTYEATERGAETIQRITGKAVTSNLIAPGTGYLTQEIGVPALVANNTAWAGQAAAYDASLGALLAQTGADPQNLGYSNPALRYDYSIDSRLARDTTAAAAMTLATLDGPTVAVLPNNLDPTSGAAALQAARTLLDAQAAVARPIKELPLTTTDTRVDTLTGLGSPFDNQGGLSPQTVARIEQQARYTDELTTLMVNDPAIAMTRYGFTLPLRRDLLTAAGSAPERATQILDGNSATLQELRSSVMLVPPGNVYTRVSESSPLLIVAQNGLPLPVEATIDYDGPENAKLNTPDKVRIPAKGSITVTMTADLPQRAERTDLHLWLATADKATVSAPITIAVQTRAGIVSLYGAAAIGALAVFFALLFRMGRKKKHSNR